MVGNFSYDFRRRSVIVTSLGVAFRRIPTLTASCDLAELRFESNLANAQEITIYVNISVVKDTLFFNLPQWIIVEGVLAIYG